MDLRNRRSLARGGYSSESFCSPGGELATTGGSDRVGGLGNRWGGGAALDSDK